MSQNRRQKALLALFLSVSLVAAACGGDDDTATDDGGAREPSTAQSDGTSGTIDVSGSSTVAPVSTRVAELFESVDPDVVTNVDGPGTGDGFELFCNGETDISDASRPIKAQEAENCAANGVEFIELKVAIDGLSVITSADNDAIDCVNFADIYALAGPESQGIDNWNDAQDLAGELGSSTDFPDAPLTISGPGEESGTYDSFVEIVIEEFNEERGADAESRPDYQSSADDNVILQGIAGSDSSFGWVGYAFASEGQGIRSLEVAAGSGTDCVEANDDTISSGEYPIARDLYIYVNAANVGSNPALEAYVDYYLSDDGIAAVSEVGYVDLADEDLEATRSVWKAKETGTRDGG